MKLESTATQTGVATHDVYKNGNVKSDRFLEHLEHAFDTAQDMGLEDSDDLYKDARRMLVTVRLERAMHAFNEDKLAPEELKKAFDTATDEGMTTGDQIYARAKLLVEDATRKVIERLKKALDDYSKSVRSLEQLEQAFNTAQKMGLAASDDTYKSAIFMIAADRLKQALCAYEEGKFGPGELKSAFDAAMQAGMATEDQLYEIAKKTVEAAKGEAIEQLEKVLHDNVKSDRFLEHLEHAFDTAQDMGLEDSDDLYKDARRMLVTVRLERAMHAFNEDKLAPEELKKAFDTATDEGMTTGDQIYARAKLLVEDATRKVIERLKKALDDYSKSVRSLEQLEQAFNTAQKMGLAASDDTYKSAIFMIAADRLKQALCAYEEGKFGPGELKSAFDAAMQAGMATDDKLCMTASKILAKENLAMAVQAFANHESSREELQSAFEAAKYMGFSADDHVFKSAKYLLDSRKKMADLQIGTTSAESITFKMLDLGGQTVCVTYSEPLWTSP